MRFIYVFYEGREALQLRIAVCGLRIWTHIEAASGQWPIRTSKSEIRNHMIDPELLLQGYRLGVFPMAMEDDSIQWFSPDPRAILPLEDFHVPHALRRLVRRKVFETTMDNAFSAVIEACAQREDTWINPEIIESYTRLHELGCAHSVEAWMEGRLAGGLYGVAVGGAFFGESMFHHITDASKIALVALVEHLCARKFALLDTQWITPHLQQFGGIEISRDHYLRLLRRAVELPRKF
jgi:leucyl/phenylalanyl-tRNA--protein transferase